MDEKKLNSAGNIFKESFIILDSVMNTGIFNNTFEENWKASKSKMVEEKDARIALAIPACVLLSFTIELKLKLLIFKETNNFVKGHELYELFDKLSVESQNFIKDEINPIYFTGGDNFEATLIKMSKQFVEWRYFHESNYMRSEYSFLKELLKAIDKKLETL